MSTCQPTTSQPPEDGLLAGTETGIVPRRGSQLLPRLLELGAAPLSAKKEYQMFQLNVATVSLKKPVSLAKSVQVYRIENPVTTVSLARRSTVSLAKRPTETSSPSEALLAYFAHQTALHAALGRDDVAAGREIVSAAYDMDRAAADYEVLSGRSVNATAAISSAFRSQDINLGNWRKLSRMPQLMRMEERRRAA